MFLLALTVRRSFLELSNSSNTPSPQYAGTRCATTGRGSCSTSRNQNSSTSRRSGSRRSSLSYPGDPFPGPLRSSFALRPSSLLNLVTGNCQHMILTTEVGFQSSNLLPSMLFPLYFRCDFVGTLIVVPDVSTLNLPGARAESSSRHKGEESEGVTGLKSLGVRDLHHKMSFLACSVQSTNNKLTRSAH